MKIKFKIIIVANYYKRNWISQIKIIDRINLRTKWKGVTWKNWKNILTWLKIRNIF